VKRKTKMHKRRGYTDTQRLTWLLENNEVRANIDVTWDTYTTRRDIDAAMRKEGVKP
jgi:hypothetical protein